MQETMLGIFTRTPLAVGAGSSIGSIDLPVARERHSRFPLIPGSGIKGVLRDLWKENEEDQTLIFGFEGDDSTQISAGNIAFGEGRIIAFPLRSAKGGFAWITCPMALERLARDTNSSFNQNFTAITGLECLAAKDVQYSNNQLVLEEYVLTAKGQLDMNDPVLALLQTLSDDPIWTKSLSKRLVILSDEMFSFFVENTSEIATRIKIDDETGVVKDGALFSQEQIPSEAMFYCTLTPLRKKAAMDSFKKKFETTRILQFGGDETVGLGFCSVKLCGGN